MRWLDRFRGTGSGSGVSMREMFSALESAIARTAAGAARTSMRLGSVSGQLGRTREALAEMLRTAGSLNDDIQKVHASSRHTEVAAAEMKRVAAEGRKLGAEGERSSNELQSQMRATIDRIDRLFDNVQSVLQVSKVIDDVA